MTTRTEYHNDESPLEGEDGVGGSEPSPAARLPFLVAAVGASAGGLEAFSSLMRGVPSDAPLALVLVQHLAREQQSLLPEILAKRTTFKVVQASDEMPVEIGHVYVIPPGAQMTAYDGHLRLRPRPEGRKDAPVDVLFRSFAQTYREKAVCVVLTGGDADGSVGLREIKALGGITIAQQPDEARIDSMPKSAIATGAVDLVLPAEQIGRELARLARLPLFRHGVTNEPVEPSPASTAEGDDFVAILRLLRRHTGVDFSLYKKPTISRRIARRMALRRLSQLQDYRALLEEDPAELEQLHEDVLIHVTSFFREPDSFKLLSDEIFPSLLAKREGALRIWVPGCSTGEEVYSLAITLFETLKNDVSGIPIQVFGTDVSNKSVEVARVGLYPGTIAADVSEARLRRHFAHVDGQGYGIGKAIRECCVFARQNVTGDPPFSKIDLIVCRNTLIYLGQPVQRKVMALFHYALKPGGYLMLGRAETVGASADLFTVIDKKFKIYGKKSGAVASGLELTSLPDSAFRQHFKHPAADSARPADVLGEANRLLLDRFAPPCIVLDSSFNIVRTRGHLGGVLNLPVSGETGVPALTVVRDGLLIGLRSALQEAVETQVGARREGLSSGDEAESLRVNIDVTPFGNARSLHFLVLFEVVGDGASVQALAADSSERPAPSSTAEDGALGRLRRELAGTRERLRSNVHDLAAANEELQSANEEILSSNEELQSTNEELDTAKEELQSTNEELSTLNEELHGRNEQLLAANNDLGNLLASVQIPIVMVSSDMKIRRFTPAAQRVLNLIPTDAGRPIGHINPNIACPELESLIAEVIQTMAPVERDVEDREGRAYSMQIRPYRTLDSRIDGAVLTLFDISVTKAALLLVSETGEAIMSTVREPILLLDAELRVSRANQAFCEQFRMNAADIERRFVYELGDRQWDIPELRRLLEEVLPNHKNFQDFAVEQEFSRIGYTRMLLDGRRIESSRTNASVILLVIRLERGA